MKKNDSIGNKEYIKKLFDEDGIRAPESLSEENMLAMLAEEDSAGKAAITGAENAAEKAFREKKARPKVLRWAALAACAVVALVGITSMYNSGIFAPNTETPGGELYTFKSKSEITQLMNKISPSYPLDFFRLRKGNVDYATEETYQYFTDGGDMSGASDAEMSAEGEVAKSNSAAGTASAGAPDSEMSSSADHSSTYLQVEDVDEADIVKVDGKYIYAVSNKQEVYILEAAGGKTRKISTIGNSGVENYVEDIFLKGDTLVTIGRVYEEDEGYIAIVSYDISDRSNPKLISQFRQSGSDVVSSRMVGNYVYLVTNTYVYGKDRIVPFCTLDGEFREMPVSDISCVPNPQYSSYIILSAVDISSGEAGKSRTKAVFGATDEIYCNDHALYCTLSEWNDKYDGEYTRIVKADLDGLDIKFSGTGLVRGRINNQFSMDEKDGYFRIATTSDRNGMDVNNLFVLDSGLKEVGKVTGFARNESIKAVRFMGSKAYVITYEAIDPLFIIDLADPKNPKIEGEVMIDGFSTLLVPIADERLLGIGHATGDNGYGGEFDSGLKLALFDISNPSEPKVLDSREFENMNSPAQSSHLALTVNDAAGYMAIPYNVFDYGDMVFIEDDIAEDAEVSADNSQESGEETESSVVSKEPENEDGVLVFGTSADGKKIEVYDKHKTGIGQNLRSPYIGDYIYAVNGRGEAEGFRYSR